MSTTPLKILVLSTFNNRDANVVRDFLFSFNKYSKHDYYYIFEPAALGRDIDLSAFDAILIFWSVYLPSVASLGSVWRKLKQARALKVLFLQDEYRNVRSFNRLMSDLGIEIMFTCVAEQDHEVFYPRELIPSLRATYTVLTGYIPSYLEALPPPDMRQRALDIAYRSRSVPYYLGDLAREKTIIAQRFQQISLEQGFHSDISVREQDRIYGDRWVDFLKSARLVLGTPSGASVVDFSGEIGWNCENYLYLHPEATYEEVKHLFFADVDWKHVIDTVSPRTFEATALGCAMVMHEGAYGGILEADRHYICIKRDYSNIADVISQMRDQGYCQEIARNAYRDLIASGNYSYETFVNWFDRILGEHAKPARVQGRPVPSKFGFYARNYFAAGQTLVPYQDRPYSLPFKTLMEKYIQTRELLHNFAILTHSSALLSLYLKYMQKKRAGAGDLKDTPQPVLLDLMHLSIIHQILDCESVVSVPFRVNVELAPEEKRLRLISSPPDMEGRSTHPRTSSTTLADLLSAIRAEQLLVEWDHSRIGTFVEYRYKSRDYSINLGAEGRYRFGALSFLARNFPDLFAAAVRPIYDALKT